MENLIKRAKDAKCSALVLTADLQVLGQRHKDIKNGLSAPPKPTIANLINLVTKPEWCMKMLNTERRTFRNIVGHAKKRGRFVFAVFMDFRTIRPAPELGRRRPH